MPIKPKYSKDNFLNLASREFTDREFYVKTFERCYFEKEVEENKVINYYGLGGIGKTSLQKKIQAVIEANYSNTKYATINMEDSVEQEAIILNLRLTIGKKYKYKFPIFDIVYMMYLMKKNPNADIGSYNTEWLDNSNTITDIIASVSNMSFISLPAKLLELGLKLGTYVNKRIKIHSNELFRLEEMEHEEILRRLPFIFAEDLRIILNEHMFSFVIFIDTYEMIERNSRNRVELKKKEEWLIELVLQLPEVLWIICGREKLDWDDYDASWRENKYLECHCIERLAPEDATKFLKSCQVDDEIIIPIVNCCNGIPYNLDLSVDTYYEIIRKEERKPQISDFSKINEKLNDRLLMYLDEGEKQILRALTIVEKWDYKIFKMFIREMSINYSIDSFEEFCRFSFVIDLNENCEYMIHELMRSSIIDKIPIDKLKEYNRLLLEYYETEFHNLQKGYIGRISERSKKLFGLMLSSAKISINGAELYNWSKKYFDFMVSTNDSIFVDYFFDILGSSLIKENMKCVISKLTILLMTYGRYSKCITLILDVRDVPTYNSTVDILLEVNLAKALQHQGKYKESKLIVDGLVKKGKINVEVINLLANYYLSIRAYKKVVEIYMMHMESEEIIIDSKDKGSFCNNIGLCFMRMRQFDNAILFYEKALSIRGQLLKKENAITYSNIGITYRKMRKEDCAIDAYKKSIELFRESLGNENKYIADVYNNLALIYAWMEMEHKTKAIELYSEAIRIMSRFRGDKHHYLSGIYHNRAKLLYHLDNYEASFKDIMVSYDLKYRNPELSVEGAFTYLLSVSEIFEKANKKSVLLLMLEELELNRGN